MFKKMKVAALILSASMASNAEAQVSRSVRDLADREASSLELGLLKLEMFLARAENIISREMPTGFSTFLAPPVFNQQDGSLVISIGISGSQQLTATNQDCERGVQTLRRLLSDSAKNGPSPQIRTMVGYSLLPTLIESEGRYQTYVTATQEIENKTRIRAELSLPNNKLRCEGSLLSRDVVFFQ